MAAAWIIWRNPDSVREFWNERRREENPRRAPVSLFDCLNEAARQDPDNSIVKFSEAQKELWHNLQEGKLTAEGLHFPASKIIEIPANEWDYLSYFDFDCPGGDADSVGCDSKIKLRYDSVRVSRDAIMELWRPISNEIDDRREKPVVGEDSKNFLTHTGFPGRPTARQLVLGEYARLKKENALPDSLKATGTLLADLFKRNHPDIASPTARTIENHIRGDYNREKPRN